MSEKSLRGATPGVDQADASSAPAAPGAPAASSGGRSSDSGGAPIEPWGGERTDRVSGHESGAARVALVPVVTPDGQVDAPASTADTRRVTDSGRTTLMGVPSPVAGQSDRPTTSPGHDVHLPAEKGRVADSRPASAVGAIPAPAPSSGRRPGKADGPGSSAGDQHVAGPSQGKDGDPVPGERSMAAAAATFRAASSGGAPPSGDELSGDSETQRGWTADRTQEFHLDTPPPPRSGFAKALATGMALAMGTGILVVSFVHSRVHGAAEPAEVAHDTGPMPVAPVPLPPPRPPENPVPPVAVEQPSEPNAAANAVPPVAPEVPAPEAAPPTTGAVDELDDGKAERRALPRAKAPSPAGRASPAARTARATPTPVRPTPLQPGVTPALPAPVVTAPTAPPPLTAGPAAEKPPAAKPETTKPYDPDMPLPPSTE